MMAVGVMVMMVMMMHRMRSLWSLDSSLRQARCHTTVVDLTVSLHKLSCSAIALEITGRHATQLLVIGMLFIPISCRTGKTRGSSAVHRLTCYRCSTANTTAEAREHATKFALDAGVIATRPNMPRCSSLYSLRQRRVSTSSIQLGADIEDGSSDRSTAVFALWISAQCFHSLVLLQSERPLMIAISERC